MRISPDIPWNRYGLIAELASRLEHTSLQFGKTVLQKMVYLLQELYGIECGYEFTLYTYGPFDSLLLLDLDQVEALEGVSVRPLHSITGGYLIKPGTANAAVREKAAGFLDALGTKRAMDDLVREFGRSSAKDLELLATMVYVDKDARKSGELLTRRELAKRVREIKIRFSTMEVDDAISRLEGKGYLNVPEA